MPDPEQPQPHIPGHNSSNFHPKHSFGCRASPDQPTPNLSLSNTNQKHKKKQQQIRD